MRGRRFDRRIRDVRHLRLVISIGIAECFVVFLLVVLVDTKEILVYVDVEEAARAQQPCSLTLELGHAWLSKLFLSWLIASEYYRIGKISMSSQDIQYCARSSLNHHSQFLHRRRLNQRLMLAEPSR